MTSSYRTSGKSWLGRTSREFQVVVAACAWPISQDAPRWLERGFVSGLDWDKFLATVLRHRVAGIVHHSLSEVDSAMIPHTVRQKLKDATLALMRSNMMCAHSAAQLTKRLEDVGIRSTILKGVPLGLLIYGSLGIRQSKDIDYLIEERDAEAADALLRQNGYLRCVPPADWTAEADRRFRMHRSHYEYRPTPGKPQVELHWRMHHNPYWGPMHPDVSSRRRVEVGTGMFVWTLEEVDLLCYLCTHGASHAWSRLKWIVDVAAMLRQNPELGMRLVERARQQGTINAAGQALLLCRDLFHVPLPENPGRPTLAMHGLTLAARRMLCAEVGVDGSPIGLHATLGMHLSHFLLGSGRRYLLTEAQNKLLVPSAWDPAKQSKPARILAPIRQASHWLLNKR